MPLLAPVIMATFPSINLLPPISWHEEVGDVRGQRELRRRLKEAKSGLKNQLGKLTEKPTLRWIFQCFQGIHLLVQSGKKQVVNLTEEKQIILSFFSLSVQNYYILSG